MPLLTVPLRPGDQEANNQPHSPLFIVRESSINGGWVVICPGDLLLIAREIFYRVPDRILEKKQCGSDWAAACGRIMYVCMLMVD